jgi:molecular chaperone DnaJ
MIGKMESMYEKDYYKILGIEKNASKNEVKMAFKQLARTYHPDVAENKEEAEVKFREINEAYSVLGDDEKRAMYDQFGVAGISGAAGGGSPFGGFGGFGGGLEDIFDAFFGGSRGGFSGSRSGRSSQPHATRGRDVRYDIEIDLEKAYTGDEMKIDLETFQTCPVCNGRRVKPGSGFTTCQTCKGHGVIQSVQNIMFGQFVTTTTCSKCQGQGQIPEQYCEECNGVGKTINRRKISFKIPPGIDTGNRIRVPSEGEAGEYGGPSGDLYIQVYIKPHDIFERQGNNLFAEIAIGFADAALGTVKEIETFDGKVSIDIPAGTQSETVFTIKGKGMPNLHGGGKGTLNVKVRVVTPTKLDKKQKELLRQFADAGPQFHPEKKGIFSKFVDVITGKQ